MNNIWRKNIYHGAIDSYTKMPSSFKIRGTLLEINENKIKVSINSERALNIILDKPIDAEIGEDIIIDRRNVIESKLVKQTGEMADDEQAAQNTQNKYDYILKSFDIPINDESMEAVESLDSYGVNITKENILSFVSAKEQLSNIGKKLDYNTAVKLVEKDVDFEKESLQKVLQEIQKVQGEKRPFSLLRFLGIKKDMSTEEAEKIAYEIYGNKAGKDITDIIKALHRAGLDTSKKNIESINNVFSKLHNIKDIENKTIIDGVKNKIETSIDNLYKLKNTIARGAIKVEQGLGKLAGRVYETYSGAVGTITEKELTQIEGGIKDRLQHMGIKITDEIIKLSKDVIAKGLDLTEENLQKIMTVKGAIIELNSDLDYEKTALLMASGVAVDKVDVVELTDMINIDHIENIKDAAGHIPAEESIALGLDRLEILEQIENIDIKTLALHMKLDLPVTLESLNLSQQLLDGDITVDDWLDTLSERLNLNYELPIMENAEQIQISAEKTEVTHTSPEKAEQINIQEKEILKMPETEQLKTLQLQQELEIKSAETEMQQAKQMQIQAEETLHIPAEEIEQLNISETEQIQQSEATNFSNNLPINETEHKMEIDNKIGVADDLRINKKETGVKLSTENNLSAGDIKNETAAETQEIGFPPVEERLSIDKTESLEVLNKLTNMETTRSLDSIAQGYLKINSDKLGALAEESYKDEIAKVIIQSGIPLNNDNMQEMYMIKRTLEQTAENLTTETLQNAADEGISVEKMDLEELAGIITLLNKEEIKQETIDLQDKQETVQDIILQDNEKIKQEAKQNIELETVNIETTGQNIEQVFKEENISLEINRQEIEPNKEDVKPGKQNTGPNKQQLELNMQKTVTDSQEIDFNRQQAELNKQGIDIDRQQLELNRQEISELIENIDIKTLAFHMKLDLPTTLESLNLSQQLIDGKITVDDWLNILNEQLDLEHESPVIEKTEQTQIQAEKPEPTNILSEDGLLAAEEAKEAEIIHIPIEKTESTQVPVEETEQINIQGKDELQVPETEQLQTQPDVGGGLSIDKTELLEVLDRLSDTKIRGLDFIAQGYLRMNSDKLGTLTEEGYKGEIAKAIIQSGISLNNDNIQEMYSLKRSLDRTIENLTPETLQNAVENGVSVEKLNLSDLSDIINYLNKDEAKQDMQIKNILDSTEGMSLNMEDKDGLKDVENITQEKTVTIAPEDNKSIKQNEKNENISANAEKIEEIVSKMKDIVDILKQIPPERKNTIISLLMKNAMPLTLKEVQNLSFFLNNQRQIGHQLDEILNLIDKSSNVEIITVAEELKNAINKINNQTKEGRQIEERPYEEFLGLLKTLENKSSFLTKEDRGTFQKSGEKLLDSLELQLQLNREDTVLQLPLMMGEYLKNLQMYIVRDKKGRKKIDPKDMSILLNFDTNNMGNVNIYVAVNYKNVVMKMGLADEGDQNLVEKYSDELEKHLKDLGYDLKDLSFRISDDNHILSMTDEIEGNNPRIKRLLDVTI